MLKITFETTSKQGARDLNEDSTFKYIIGNTGIFAIADGLGGHGRGEVASQTVVQKLNEICSDKDHTVEQHLNLSEAFDLCQQRLLSKQKELNALDEMKTTLTLLKISGDSVSWGHVGDTRLYAFKRGRVVYRTLDHSVPQMLVLSGDIPERKIRYHPDRNLLLKVMGVEWEEPQYEISDDHDISKYDSFLLCSDGFWELINERQMCSCLRKSKTVNDWIEQMTAIVEKNGKGKDMDNYSATGVWLR